MLESDDVSQIQQVIPTENVELLFHRNCPMKRNGEMVHLPPFPDKAFHRLTSSPAEPSLWLPSFSILLEQERFSICRSVNYRIWLYQQRTYILLLLKNWKNKFWQRPMMTPVSGWLRLFCSAIYIHKRSTTTGEWPQLSIPFINQVMSCPHPSWRKRYALAKNNSGGNSMSTLATAQRFCAHRPVPQSLLHVAKQSRHEFTALAYECGYYDQAHLTKEF